MGLNELFEDKHIGYITRNVLDCVRLAASFSRLEKNIEISTSSYMKSLKFMPFLLFSSKACYLSPQEMKVLDMYNMSSFSEYEIAKTLGIDLNNLKKVILKLEAEKLLLK